MDTTEEIISIRNVSQLINERERFKLLFLNARSINSIDKFDFIKQVAESITGLDIICLVETWLKDIDLQFFSIPNYTDYHNVRIGRGGGVSIYVKNNVTCLSMKKIEGTVQMIMLKLLVKNKVVNLIVVYNPNVSLITECLDTLVPLMQEIKNENTLILGDFNVDLNKDSKAKNDYLTATSLSGFSVLNTNITRPRSGTVIDHALTNIIKGDSRIYTIENTNDVSDHNFLLWTLSMKKETGSKYKISKINYEKINNYLDGNEFNLNASNDAEEFSEYLHKHLAEAISNSETISMKYEKDRRLNPWATKEFIELTHLKNDLYKKMKCYTNNKVIQDDYKRIAKATNLMRGSLKKNYTNKTIDKCIKEKKSIWNVLKETAGLHNNKKNDVKQLSIDNSIINDQKEMANAFNKFYINVGPILASQMRQGGMITYTKEVISSVMQSSYVNEQKVQNIICDLSNKHSSPNKISNILLKKISPHVVPALTKLVNLSFSQGVFPTDCKITKVIPLFKSGKSDDVGNYRPLSVLSANSRVLEKAMMTILLKYLEEIKFFYKRQYGFKKDRDANGAIFDLVASIQTSLDKGNKCSAIFIDLRKAFDTVDHHILLEKMYQIGIRGNVL